MDINILVIVNRIKEMMLAHILFDGYKKEKNYTRMFKRKKIVLHVKLFLFPHGQINSHRQINP
ncbi:hypothetical protein PVBG_06187 [Plasmodium vivax Brazil I]|uniref:Uncharacterized protein n=1 Tax=Plasmodium vivax (strain Brazil I) TaxID=1033975 RepID=A0A0J9T1Q6_PLAV1|nr:hypothetical protein PVBG_06187 [Plasmodium vivax Brazil I]